MDWFSWLSQTSLELSLVYEYGLAFAHNELEEEDIVYFNHEFLQSMGISIAKHRLEILKLARQEKGASPRPMSRLLVAIRRTKRCLGKYIRTWIRKGGVVRAHGCAEAWLRVEMEGSDGEEEQKIDEDGGRGDGKAGEAVAHKRESSSRWNFQSFQLATFSVLVPINRV